MKIKIIFNRLIYTGKTYNPLTYRIKTDAQSFKPNANFIKTERMTIIIMKDKGATIRIFSITFNMGKLFSLEEKSSP